MRMKREYACAARTRWENTAAALLLRGGLCLDLRWQSETENLECGRLRPVGAIDLQPHSTAKSAAFFSYFFVSTGQSLSRTRPCPEPGHTQRRPAAAMRGKNGRQSCRERWGKSM